ncbi:IS1595 family transposase [Flavobacterium pallidum]|uniref:IS1595 family transposase n=1 Tax=Flavobacterium pallidum TaxID=2172098 RepID=A0A2S1SKA0_9FLAO|nr:IS1595 family transposase [Flavobacterium pallidum]AWI26815.1 IS1595 family transposase [Flavobacterium pallidum]
MKTAKDLRDFDSLFQLLDYFTTEEKCEQHLAVIRWNGEPTCAYCESTKVSKLGGKTNRYKCYGCKKQFGVKVGTIFHDSKVSLRKWFVAIYLITTNKKGISSHQLARHIQVTQKSAWFILQRVREVYNDKPEVFTSTVEIDETFIGGANANRHESKKVKGGHGGAKHTPVLGIIERGGKVYALPVANRKAKTIIPIMVDQVAEGATVYTDEFKSYASLNNRYEHDFVCHRAKEYVSGNVHTNGIENFWSHLSRTIFGTYHHVTPKYLGRYVNEQAFRHNNRDLSEGSKFDVALANGVNVRISHKQLTNG